MLKLGCICGEINCPSAIQAKVRLTSMVLLDFEMMQIYINIAKKSINLVFLHAEAEALVQYNLSMFMGCQFQTFELAGKAFCPVI